MMKMTLVIPLLALIMLVPGSALATDPTQEEKRNEKLIKIQANILDKIDENSAKRDAIVAEMAQEDNEYPITDALKIALLDEKYNLLLWRADSHIPNKQTMPNFVYESQKDAKIAYLEQEIVHQQAVIALLSDYFKTDESESFPDIIECHLDMVEAHKKLQQTQKKLDKLTEQ